MSFEAAMRFVEDRPFPGRPRLHARRLAWLLARSALAPRAAPLPWALVAGSYGKASTTRFLAAIQRRLLDATGERRPVVLATKPPLRETTDGNRERYQLLGAGASDPRWISPDEFVAEVDALAPTAEALAREAPELGPLAPYDLRYALLWRWAHTVDAAFAVIEANIGLRDDATSALPSPVLQLLTPIATDHTSLLVPPSPLPNALEGLGDRAGPVWHKAGGLRSGVPLVLGRQDPQVERAVLALASERGVPEVVRRGPDFEVLARAPSFAGTSARVRVRDVELDLTLPVAGAFQVDNAVHAAAAARELARGAPPEAWASAVRDGTSATRVPGRLDVVAHRPLTLRQVGESAAKMQAFVEELRALRPSAPGRLVACATFLARVDEARSLPCILARAPLDALVVTRASEDGDAGDLSPLEVETLLAAEAPGLRVLPEPDPDRALARARAEAGGDGVLLVVGSGLVARTGA